MRGGQWRVAVGRRALGDQPAAGRVLKRRLVKFLDIAAEGLGLFEDPLALAAEPFSRVDSMSTGIFPSMLGMIVRSSPAPVIARICDWSSISVSTSTGDRGFVVDAREPPAARGRPTVCEQPAASSAAAHQTASGLAGDAAWRHPFPDRRLSARSNSRSDE